MRDRCNILLLILILLLAGVGLYGYMQGKKQEVQSKKLEIVADITEETHGMMVFEYLSIDTLMLGKWQHTLDIGWYRVYTMEPAGNDYCWGREWNTSEDIFEEDLIPYGNGWFMWKKNGNNVVEVHMTDNHTASIPHEYEVLELSSEKMQYIEKADLELQEFRKKEDY